MIGFPLPYHDNASSRDEAAMAFAAAGAITALGGLETGDFGVLDRVRRRDDSLSVAWTLPWAGRQACDWGTSARALALEWQSLCAGFDSALPARLIVGPHRRAWHPEEIRPALAAAKALAYLALAGRGPYDDWRATAPGYLGAVSIAGTAGGHDLHWNWPPRTLVNGFGSGLDAIQPRYGRDTLHFTNEWAGYDLSISNETDRALRDFGKDSGNFNLAFDPFPLPGRIEGMLTGLELSQPIGLLPYVFDQSPTFYPYFIDEVSHDAPYDLAFFRAALQSFPNVTEPAQAPLILSPLENYPAQMNSSRLTRRVEALLYDLPAIAEYSGTDSVTLPFDAPEFGLPAGPVSLEDLQLAVETALERGSLRFDAESQTGSSQWALEIATEPYRGGFGSADDADSEAESMPGAGDPFDFGGPDLPVGGAGGALPQSSPTPAASAPSGPAPRRSRSKPRIDLQDDSFVMRSATYPTTEDAAERAAEDMEMAELAPADDAPDGESEKRQHAAETPRYTTLNIYPGLVFSEDAAPMPLNDDEPLQARGDYTLSLALRAKLSGIAPGNTPQPATALRKKRETITVYAVASCDYEDGPNFVDPLQVFEWNYDKDTAPVFFRFSMPARISREPAPISVRLYSKNLHLLDIVTIDSEKDGRDWVRRLYWDKRGVSPLPEDQGVDALAFHITRRPGGFHAEAIMSRGGDMSLSLDPGHLLRGGDLDMLLAQAREFWTTQALSTFATKMAVGNYSYQRDVLPDMIGLGHQVWRALFGSGVENTVQRLGGWIAGLGLAEGTVIRVTTDDAAADFVFPWQLMLPPGSTDPGDFWGLRYPIEVTRKFGPDLRPKPVEDTRVGIVVDKDFRDFVDHPQTLDAVFASNPSVSRFAMQTGEDVMRALLSSPAADLYYFFSHGSTSRRALALPDDLKRKLEAEIGSAKDWRGDLLKLVSSGNAEARIKTDTFTLGESQFRAGLREFTPRRPIVFLNMCHSADLMPGQSDGLTRLFLDFGSAAVLGTECPMNALFADAFAAEVLGRLLQNMPLGEAVRQARLHFHNNNNLLGFAYALYGHADATLFAPEPENQEISHEH